MYISVCYVPSIPRKEKAISGISFMPEKDRLVEKGQWP
jgi:hypothetical protein